MENANYPNFRNKTFDSSGGLTAFVADNGEDTDSVEHIIDTVFVPETATEKAKWVLFYTTHDTAEMKKARRDQGK